LDFLAKGEKMTLEEYQGFLVERRQVRETFSRLKDHVDACVTLAATGPAPVGLGPTTGNMLMNLPASLLGTPAITLPVFWTEGFPLGLQVTGFNEEDAALISVSASLLALF
jgi:Asp-tRNA(Asn)/Glu-tRNA(Gln) amidotransferase A subunit family amidase